MMRLDVLIARCALPNCSGYRNRKPGVESGIATHSKDIRDTVGHKHIPRKLMKINL